LIYNQKNSGIVPLVNLLTTVMIVGYVRTVMA